MEPEEKKDLENQDQDVEGHKVSREAWSRGDAADEDDVEGHKVSREAWSRGDAADEDDVEGHKVSRE